MIRKGIENMTKYSIDTLINTIAYVEDICRANKAKAEKTGYKAGVEYWQKEYEDLEKLSEELWSEKIVK
jgi:hypothetical protein